MNDQELRAMKSRIRKPYRALRDTPRRAAGMDVYEDPAPPWVVYVLDHMAATFSREMTVVELEPMIVRALRWCEAGEPRQRAEHLLTLLALWPGRKQDAFSDFLHAAARTGAGRAKGAKPRALGTVSIPDAWPEPKPKPEMTVTNGASADEDEDCR